jgi:hypothetical protein
MAARKTSTKPTRIWKFSARVEDPTAAREILFRAHRYYNRLVEIERARRGRFAAIRREYAPALAVLEDEWLALDDQVVELYKETKRARAKHWRKSGGEKRRLLPEEFEAKEKALDAQKREVSGRAKTLRSDFSSLISPARDEFKRRTKEIAGGCGPRRKSIVNAEVLAAMLDEPAWHPAWKAIARSDDQAHDETIAARKVCGVYAGTYSAVEEAFDDAKADSAPRVPGFHRFDGTGRIRLQGEPDATWLSLRTTHRRIIVESIETRKSARSQHAHTSARSRMLKIQLDQSIPGAPSTVTLTCKVHRPPPDDAEVKWITLVFKRRGLVTYCELQLTLEHDSFADPKRPAGLREPEHVKIGWPRVDGGIRVAAWSDGSVICPDSILSTVEFAESIESRADKLREEAVQRIGRVLRLSGSHADLRRLVGDRQRVGLRVACERYAQHVFEDVGLRWKAWVEDRKSRHEDLYAPICTIRRTELGARESFAWWCWIWAKKDAHLEQLAVDLKRKNIHRRDTHYRKEAIRLATEFAFLTIDKYSITNLKERAPLTMPGEAPRDVAAWQVQVAAPGRFREILVEVMGGRCTLCERPNDAKIPGGARGKKRKTRHVLSEGEVSATEVE